MRIGVRPVGRLCKRWFVGPSGVPASKTCNGTPLPLSAIEHRFAPPSDSSFGCKVVASGLQKAFRGRRRIPKMPAFAPENGGSAYRIRTGVTAVRGQ